MKKLNSFFKTKWILVPLILLTLSVGQMWGAKITYTFNSKSWGATPANWTSGADGGQLTTNQGIQVTTSYSGANGTSPVSFTAISKIEVQYCTNASKGVGTIKVQVGSNTEKTFSVTKPSSGGTTLKTATFNYTTTETGSVKVTAECTTNSVYIYSVTIYYQTAVTLKKNDGASDGSVKINHDATAYVTGTFNEVTRDGYNCTGYYTASSGGTKVLNANGSFAGANITVSTTDYIKSSKWAYEGATLDLHAQWEAACTSLDQINGSVSWTNGEATVSFADLADVTGWGLKYKKSSQQNWSTYSGSFSAANSTRSNSTAISGLEAGSQYDFKVTGTYNGSSYCTGAFEVPLNPSSSSYVPKITPTASLTDLGYGEGNDPVAQEFTVSGVGLTGNLTVSAPSNFQVKVGDAEWNSSQTITASGTLSATTVKVRAASGLHENDNPSGDITISGGGAASQTVAVVATITASCTAPSITSQPTGVTCNLNETATLSVTATGNEVGYQWYSNTTNSKNGASPIDGADEASYTAPTNATGTKYYYCVTNSGACTTESNVVAVTVNTPTLTVSETSRAFGDKAVGPENPYYTMTFTVSGSNLAKDAPITISGASGMFSVDKTSVDQTSAGEVSTTTITVTYNPTAAGSHNATLTIASTSATSKTVALSGTGKWKVTFMNGTNLEEHSSTLVANNAAPSKPDSNPAVCDGVSTTFVGWTQSKWSGRKTQSEVDELTAANVKIYKSGDNLPAMTDHVTYYPVFAKDGSTETEETIEFTTTNLSSYAAVNATYGGIAFKSTGKFGKQTWSTKEYIQCENGKVLYNSAAFPGYIKSITITPESPAGVNGSAQLAVGTSSQPTSYSSDITSESTTNYTSSNAYTYLAIKANGATALRKISITYTAISASYSEYITTCLNCSVNPTIGEANNSNVTASNATVSCAGITKGTCDIDEYGFFYKIGTSGVTKDDTKIQISNAVSDEDVSSFSKAFEAGALTPNTHYYFKPYAKVNGVYYLGSETDFTTKSISVSSNNTDFGTVSGENFAWTGAPATGYTYAATAYTLTTGNNTTVTFDGNDITIASTSSENVAVVINFAPKTMTVTLNNNGATTVGAANVTGTYNAGLPSIAENLPEKTGYTFQGYYENQNGGGKKYYKADGTADHAWDKEVATTIHAHWSPISYTVTLAATDATTGVAQEVSATYDADMPLVTTADGNPALVAPTRTGYTFTGWWNGETQYYSYPNSAITSAHVWDIANSTTTLTAQWSINSYTLTWSLDGGKVATAGTAAEKDATGTPSSEVVYNSAITIPLVSRTGYTFAGWNTTPASNMPAEDVTYTASWTPIQSVVTLNNNGATTAGTESVTATYDADMPTITPPTKTGYRFDGYWTEGGGKQYYKADGTSANVMKSSSAMTIVAKWTPLLSYSINGTVDNTLTKGTDLAMPTSAAVPVSCGDCWELAGWSTDPDATSVEYANGAQHTFDAPTTLYAVFGKKDGESYSEYATTPSCPTYEVRWHVIDNVTTVNTTECTGITSVPAVSDALEFRCKGTKTVFMGWSETNIGFNPTSDADEIAALNLFTKAKDAPTIDDDKDFYAVFAEVAPEKPVSKTVTYTISSKNTLTTTGDALTGSSASIVETYGTSKQMTSGNSQTLTLTGYSGYKITKIVLSMRSNQNGGAGKLSYAVNNGSATYLIGTSGVAFNNSAWNGAYTTSYVNVTKDNLNIACGSTNTIIKIEATANSLYCESYAITYERIVTYSDYFTECCPQKAVTVADLDEAVGTIIADKELACEGDVVTLLMEENHYDFVSWNVHKTGDESTKPTAPVATGEPGEYTFAMPTPAYPVTVEANWTPKNYKVTIASAEGGTATVKESYSQDDNGKWIVPYGETVTLQATPVDGDHYFAGWTLSPEIPGAAIDQAEMEITMPGNFTATPAFAVIAPSKLTLVEADNDEFTLEATLADGSEITNMNAIDAGTGIKVTYTMNGQYEVTSWQMVKSDLTNFTSYSTSGNAVTFNMPNKDLSIRLNVQSYVTLGLSAQNGSISSVEIDGTAKDLAASYNVHEGEMIEVVAIPTDNTYKFVEWQKTGIADEDFTSTGTDATLEVATSNMTLNAVFAKKTSYTLTLVSGGKTQEVITAYEGESVLSLLNGKNATALTGYTFKGWSTLENGTAISSDDLKLNANTTVYAVYSKNAYYEKVTSTSSITNGQYLIVYEDGEVAFDGGLTTLDASSNTIDVVISNNKIKVSEATEAAEFTIKTSNGSIKSASNKYIGRSSNSNGLDANDSETSNTLSIVDGNFVVVGTGGAYLRYNSSSGQERFRYFKSDSYTNQKAIQLYKFITTGENESNPTTVVEEGEEYVIDEETTMNVLTIEEGGSVVLDEDLTVEDLVINTSLGTVSGDDIDGGKSGQVSGNGSITATGDVYIQIELTQADEASYGWYAFSVPFKVDAMNGVYFGDTKLQNEVGYAIMAFHENKYADGEYAWKKYRDIMEPGKLYLITVGDTDYKKLRFKKVAGEPIVASSTVSLDKSGAGDNAGWNGVGNPNLQKSRMDAYTYMQFLDHDANSFQARQAGQTDLLVGTAFMLQRTDAKSSIEIKKGGNDGEGIIALAPAREPESIEKTIFEAKLKNAETGKTEDHLFFTAREDATSTYEAGRDVTKLSMGNAKNAQMTISAYGKQLCAADFPLVNDKAEYPLTLTAPKAGNYAIYTEESREADIYLTKDGAIIWNLSMGEYEVELPQGTTTGYGLLLVKKAPQVETGLGGTDATEVGAQKVIIDENVYILRGEKLYDVTGKAVK